jgi:flagellar biosynthetic protein FliR
MDDLWSWWWVLWRSAACLSVAPLIGGIRMPGRVRLMAILVLSWAMVPVARSGGIPPMMGGWLEIFLLTVRETLVGLTLGFASRFVVFAAQMAGQWVSSEMGLQSGQILSPGSGESSNEASIALEFLAILVLFTFQLHHAWIRAFAETYRVLPITGDFGIANDGLLLLFTGLAGDCLGLSVRLAMPVMAGGFLLTVTLLLLGRALPQLPVFQDSFLFRAVVGLFLFGASLHLMASHLNSRAVTMPEDLISTARVLRAVSP